MKDKRTEYLFARIRDGESLTSRQRFELVVRLSLPAIFAQISYVIMNYIDAAMVGHLGATQAASIALVATSLWMLWGLTTSFTAGFSVQVAQRIGAKEFDEARSVLRQTIVIGSLISAVMAIAGAIISPYLPTWLGGEASLRADASIYFLIFSLGMPISIFSFVSASMLRSTGNVKLPSMINIGMCFLDVLFNMLLIFPTATYELMGLRLTIPGADLGVAGAALGTILAECLCGLIMIWFLVVKDEKLNLIEHRGSFKPTGRCLRRALNISSPMAVERCAMTGAQIVTTMIVAPLGTFSLAAHSFAITAESLCYMPGYGIADAASSLVGQSIGARRAELAKSFAWFNVTLAMVVMAAMGVVMFIFAPLMIGIMTETPEIIQLGSGALRIEAFAEPLFAAAIVIYGIFVGAGYTLQPALINLSCMWLLRLSLAFILASRWGLYGVWFAMALDLCLRGSVFLLRLRHFDWTKRRAIDN